MKKILIGLLLIISTSVIADQSNHGKKHHNEEPTVINNTTVIEKTTIVENTINYNSIESAIGMAIGQHHFDYGTYAYQQSVTAAVTDCWYAYVT